MFLWHCPRGRPHWVLPSTLPCGARTFLGRDVRPRPPGLLPFSLYTMDWSDGPSEGTLPRSGSAEAGRPGRGWLKRRLGRSVRAARGRPRPPRMPAGV